MRRYFRLPSQSLDYISHQLGLGGKIKMEFQDWIDIVEKNEDGGAKLKKMIKYGKKDVEDTRTLWHELLQHFEPRLNMAAWFDRDVCRVCGSRHIHKNGTRVSGKIRYQRYCCNDCGAVSRKPLNKENVSHGRIG